MPGPRGLILLLSLGWVPAALGQGPGTPATAGRQVLVNPGFEKGLAGWKVSGHRLVEDPLAAHQGLRCLLGEVSRRDHGQTVRRTVKLQKSKLYRFSIWAKADRSSRLTVWIQIRGQRRVIANWHQVGRKWRRFRTHFTVEEDGPVTLGIIAPSAHWAPTGRMWIDDLALIERPLVPSLRLSGQTGFDDFPSLVRTGKDEAWAAWLSFRQGQDSLQATRLVRANRRGEFEVDEPRQVISKPGLALMDPTVTGDESGQAWLVWAAEEADNWDIWAQQLNGDGAPRPIRVTTDPATDIHPAAIVHRDTLWVAWESNRGGERQIFLTAVRGAAVGQAQQLSSAGSNNYQPSISFVEPDTLWAAWHSFRGGNMDLYARELTAGALSPEKRLTKAPAIDRNVQLAARAGEVWLAWEHASYKGVHVGKTSSKRVQVAKLVDGRLRAPVGIGKTGLWKAAESPHLTIDDKGRVWVAARIPRDRNSGWDVGLWRFSSKGWSPVSILSRRKGMNRRPSVAAFGRQGVVCYQSDNMEGRYRSIAQAEQTESDVILARLVPDGPVGGGALPLRAYEPPDDRFEFAALRTARGEDRAGWQVVDEAGRSRRLLFGDLHEHTDVSVCSRTQDETGDQTFQMMRDLVAYDFGALTDHGYNFNTYLWRHQGKLVRSNADPGHFLSLLGQEWTSTFEAPTAAYPHGHYGHRNLILADPQHPRWYNALEGLRPEALYRQLRSEAADFVAIPHQLADSGNVPVDWSGHDGQAEPVAEIFQQRGSYECRGCPRQAERSLPGGPFLQDLWAEGLVIGVVAAPDHAGGQGKAAVYAETFTRESILQAIRERRTYATTGARILLDLRVAGQFMGAQGPPVAAGQTVDVSVRVAAPGRIRSVDVIRDNQRLAQIRPLENECRLTWTDAPEPGAHYYYVRVTLKNGEMAWSSPVWLGRTKP